VELDKKERAVECEVPDTVKWFPYPKCRETCPAAKGFGPPVLFCPESLQTKKPNQKPGRALI